MDTLAALPRNISLVLFCLAASAFTHPAIANPDSPQAQSAGCSCGTADNHWGNDWTAKAGTPVPVAQNGTVIQIEQSGVAARARKEPNCGRYVVVRHEYPGGRIVFSRYAQLGQIEEVNGVPLKVGQTLKQGQIIGKVGDIGLFHFEVRPVPSGGNQSKADWLSVPPVNPNSFDFINGQVQEAQGFPWDSYKAVDIDSIYETDMKQESTASAGQKIWSPLRKLHFTSALIGYPESCKLGNLGYALTVNGVSLKSLPPISTCIRLKSSKGREFSVFIQDQVGSFLPKEIKLGEQVDIYAAYIFADEVSKGLGMIVNEYKRVETAAKEK
jgi:hypothetical protein